MTIIANIGMAFMFFVIGAIVGGTATKVGKEDEE